MAFNLMKSLSRIASSKISSPPAAMVGVKSLSSAPKSYDRSLIIIAGCHRLFSSSVVKGKKEETLVVDEIQEDVLTSGRTLSDILKELNKKVPGSLIRARTEPDGFSVRYIPWHIVNRIMNLHAPEWSGEVRNITYSPDGKSVSVIYRVTIYGTDAEIFRESIGTASVNESGYGDPVQKAEAMAFRRACARFGLGLHLYHEEL